MTDPIRDAIDRFAAVPRELATTPRRPNRAVVQRLLDHNGQQVQMHDTTITEDVDGTPSGITTTTTTATLAVSLEALGWTQTEWDDPTITE